MELTGQQGDELELLAGARRFIGRAVGLAGAAPGEPQPHSLYDPIIIYLLSFFPSAALTLLTNC